jgi:hypothetical protein
VLLECASYSNSYAAANPLVQKHTQSPFSLYRNKVYNPFILANNKHTSPKNTISILSLQKQSIQPIHSANNKHASPKKNTISILSTTQAILKKKQIFISPKTIFQFFTETTPPPPKAYKNFFY